MFLWVKLEQESGEVSVIKHEGEEFKNKEVVSHTKFCRDIKKSHEEKPLDIAIRSRATFKSGFEGMLEARLHLTKAQRRQERGGYVWTSLEKKSSEEGESGHFREMSGLRRWPSWPTFSRNVPHPAKPALLA